MTAHKPTWVPALPLPLRHISLGWPSYVGSASCPGCSLPWLLAAGTPDYVALVRGVDTWWLPLGMLFLF